MPGPLSADVGVTARHERMETSHGIVHRFFPAGYRPDTAGVVIYLHGHGGSADQAWNEHALGQKFQESGLNAVLLIPDAPRDAQERLHWASSGELLTAMLDFEPKGPVVVLGHSGAFRTIAAWLGKSGRIDEIILLDALYGHTQDFLAWLDGDPSRRLALVSTATQKNAETFLRSWEGAVHVRRLPHGANELPERHRKARVIGFDSPYDHMEIVETNRVIPLLLRWTRLGSIPVREG